MMRRRLPGPLETRDLGHGLWQLRGGSAGPVVYLRMGDVAGAALSGGIQSLELEWKDAGVGVSINRAAGVEQLTARSAVIHETQSRLYDELPLAAFDAQARKFWRWVFRLIRMPGGRRLLGLIARHRR